MPHIGQHRIQPEMADHLLQFLDPFFIGRQLRAQISDVLVRIARRIQGAIKNGPHLGFAVSTGINQLEIVYQHTFLINMRRVWRGGSGCLPANIGVMAAAGDKEENFTAFKHGRYDSDVGKMGSAIIRVVQYIGVTWIDFAFIVTQHRPHRFSHRAEMHRHMRGVGNQRPARIENGTGEIQPFLDIHRQCRVLQRVTHLLGNRHEQVVKHLQHHRIAACPDGHPFRAGNNAAQHQITNLGHLRLPSGFNNGCRGGFDDQCRPVDPATCGDSITVKYRRSDRRATHIGVYSGTRHKIPASCGLWHRFDIESLANCFDRDRGRNHPFPGHGESKAGPVRCFVGSDHFGDRPVRHLQRCVRPVITQMNKPQGFHAAVVNSLTTHFTFRNSGQLVQFGLQPRDKGLGQTSLDGALTQRADIRQPHTIRRQHAGKRMHKHRIHAQHVGDETGMLAASTAKTLQGIIGYIITALHRDFLDRIGHILDRDTQESVRQLFRRPAY